MPLCHKAPEDRDHYYAPPSQSVRGQKSFNWIDGVMVSMLTSCAEVWSNQNIKLVFVAFHLALRKTSKDCLVGIGIMCHFTGWHVIADCCFSDYNTPSIQLIISCEKHPNYMWNGQDTMLKGDYCSQSYVMTNNPIKFEHIHHTVSEDDLLTLCDGGS
jgi:hypothetical protein